MDLSRMQNEVCFHSDIEDHNDSTGHKLTEKVMLKVAPSAETLA
jgi:hypothetical protein